MLRILILIIALTLPVYSNVNANSAEFKLCMAQGYTQINCELAKARGLDFNSIQKDRVFYLIIREGAKLGPWSSEKECREAQNFLYLDKAKADYLAGAAPLYTFCTSVSRPLY